MNETSGEIFRATVSGIWIAIGSVILVCAVGCFIALAAGNSSILWCAVGCGAGGPALISAGVAWYYLFRPKNVTSS